jgi:hypothetical protein
LVGFIEHAAVARKEGRGLQERMKKEIKREEEEED